jgi:hypothetical protein
MEAKKEALPVHIQSAKLFVELLLACEESDLRLGQYACPWYKQLSRFPDVFHFPLLLLLPRFDFSPQVAHTTPQDVSFLCLRRWEHRRT